MRSKRIYEIVKKYFDVDDDFMKTREDMPVIIRAVNNKLSRVFTLESLSSIGKNTGKDHATVIHSINMFDDVYITMKSPFNVEKCFDDLVDILTKFDEDSIIDYNDIIQTELSEKLDIVSAENIILKSELDKLKIKLNRIEMRIKIKSISILGSVRVIAYTDGTIKTETI